MIAFFFQTYSRREPASVPRVVRRAGPPPHRARGRQGAEEAAEGAIGDLGHQAEAVHGQRQEHCPE